ncbi:hypothetical protein [Trujillonella endophytica]|uniref:Lipoprotein LprG n=1 Tax=Trujillonella endophytica TaxID=673521 RepID=A0A1H8UB31_9ACTN|nr:hypothetical protein [Trujillella endophytica]SEP00063.1 hypothetical protein SAMN05660991_02720 [Trujillella endophytica]
MRVRALALALAGAAALTLTACGDDSADDGSFTPLSSSPTAGVQSGPELITAAADALAQAGSVRLQGTVPVGEGTTDVDLQLIGEDAAGSLTVAGATVQVVVVGGDAYVQADAAFWAAQELPPAAVAQLEGVWVLAPAEGGAALGVLTLARVVTEFRRPAEGADGAEVTTGNLEGQPVWEVRSADGAVMRIASEGTPYPLELERTGLQAGIMRLSEFGVVPPIQAPAEFLDLSSLAG